VEQETRKNEREEQVNFGLPSIKLQLSEANVNSLFF